MYTETYTPFTKSALNNVLILKFQDSVSLLENMTVVSKNPSYCTHDLDETLVAELNEKHIPYDKVKLLEEIGEGAFGKVFKGNQWLWSNWFLEYWLLPRSLWCLWGEKMSIKISFLWLIVINKIL